MAGLVDLDELTLRCRDEQAREHIGEAVACYKAGAFRSCIVSTWNAVVFDYLHKLRELEMAGDNNAKKQLVEFDAIRLGGENRLKDALDFERELLNVAEKEFELFGPLEREDLGRLQKDRSRCAHPSMQSAEEPYQPTAELARAHLRSAVEIMLSREPVQGKAAFNLICAEIASPYFPRNPDDAVKHLNSGPLARARKALVRNLLIGITKSYLTESLPPDERTRQLVAIVAILQMHRCQAEQTLKNDLPQVFRVTADENLLRLLRYSWRIDLAWECFDASTKSRLTLYVKSVSNSEKLKAIYYALKSTPLQSEGIQRLKDLNDKDFAVIVQKIQTPVLKQHAIMRFARAGSFDDAKQLFEALILPIADQMTADDLKIVLQAVAQNRQILGAWGIPEGLQRLYCETSALRPDTVVDWQNMLLTIASNGNQGYLSEYYGELEACMTSDGFWPIAPGNSTASDTSSE